MAVVLQRIDVDLSYLSEPEQDQIRAVNERDELLRQELHDRIELVSSSVSQLPSMSSYASVMHTIML